MKASIVGGYHMSILHVTKDNFDEEVLKEERTVLVDYWAPWCMPCKMLSPILDQIASESDDVKICKINVDEEPELVMNHKVMSIPTLQVIKQGDVVTKSVGLRSKNEILSMLQLKSPNE